MLISIWGWYRLLSLHQERIGSFLPISLCTADFFICFLICWHSFFFGVPVERKTGTKEFVLYYLLVGTLGGVFSFFVYKAVGAYLVVLIGASGAIFSLLLLYAVLFPRSVIFLWGIIPVPAPLLILGYAVIELINIFSANDGIAHFTHFIGLVIGWLYIVVRFGINPLKVWDSQMR